MIYDVLGGVIQVCLIYAVVRLTGNILSRLQRIIRVQLATHQEIRMTNVLLHEQLIELRKQNTPKMEVIDVSPATQ